MHPKLSVSLPLVKGWGGLSLTCDECDQVLTFLTRNPAAASFGRQPAAPERRDYFRLKHNIVQITR